MPRAAFAEPEGGEERLPRSVDLDPRHEVRTAGLGDAPRRVGQQEVPDADAPGGGGDAEPVDPPLGGHGLGEPQQVAVDAAGDHEHVEARGLLVSGRLTHLGERGEAVHRGRLERREFVGVVVAVVDHVDPADVGRTGEVGDGPRHHRDPRVRLEALRADQREGRVIVGQLHIPRRRRELGEQGAQGRRVGSPEPLEAQCARGGGRPRLAGCLGCGARHRDPSPPGGLDLY